METLIIIAFLYAFFSVLAGMCLGVGHALNEDSLYTPKDFIQRVKGMDNIQIYHTLFIFVILTAILYYIFFSITILCMKIGKITIYRRNK